MKHFFHTLAVHLTSFTRRVIIAALVMILILGGIRLALPALVKDYVNRKLDSLPEYDGHVGDIDIHLLRGAYSIEGVDIVKTAGEVPVPLFSAREVRFSVEWDELLYGALVGEIDVFEGALHFVKGPTEEESQTHIDDHWLEVVDDLFPFRINRFEMHGGEIHYHEFFTNPRVDVYVSDLSALLTNLTNARKVKEPLPSSLHVSGRTLGEGNLRLNMRLDPFARDPTFDLNLEVKQVDMVALNSLLQAYARIDVNEGIFSVYTELIAADGAFKGYVKPLFENLDIVDLNEKDKNLLQKAWEAIVAGLTHLIKNKPEDRLATVVPVSGKIEDPDASVWSTVANLLRNGFVEAIQPRLDHSIKAERG